MLANHGLKLAIVVVLAGCWSAQAEDHVKWQPNLETAQRVAAQSNRLVLIHFGAPWCKPCTKLEQDVLSKSELGPALEPNFVCVKLNVDEAPGTARMYGVSSIPTDVIITPSGKLVSAQPSAPSVNQYAAQMTQIADGHKKLQHNAYAQARAGAAATPAIQTVANTTVSATAPVQQDAYSDDRYADYFKNKPQGAAGVPAPVGAPQQQFAASPQVPVPNYPAQPNGAPMQQQAGIPPQQSAMPAPQATAQFAPYTTMQAPQQQQAVQPPVQQRVATAPAVQLPAGSPQLGLDGNCPVQLIEQKRWVRGDVRYGAVHRGRTYLFTGPEEQKRFLANPDAYSPMISGNDPVLALDHGQEVAGRREHGVFFNNQIYLFSGEASLQRFNQNPNRYAGQILQAMRPSQNMPR